MLFNKKKSINKNKNRSCKKCKQVKYCKICHIAVFNQYYLNSLSHVSRSVLLSQLGASLLITSTYTFSRVALFCLEPTLAYISVARTDWCPRKSWMKSKRLYFIQDFLGHQSLTSTEIYSFLIGYKQKRDEQKPDNSQCICHTLLLPV